MRRELRLTVGLLLVAACTSTSESTADHFISTAPTFPQTAPAVEPATPETFTSIPGQVLGPGSARGVLPDGTGFDVRLEPSRVEWLTGVSGAIVVDLDDGTSPIAGILDFARREIESPGWIGKTFRMGAGSDSVELEVDDSVVDALGPTYQDVIEAAIEGSQIFGYPVLHLSPPLRWADDDETPDPMQVRFGSFLIQRGCGELAAACSPNRTVQLIPIELLSPEAIPWPGGQRVSIESPGRTKPGSRS